MKHSDLHLISQEEILARRAKAIASVPEGKHGKSEETMTLVRFLLGIETWAIDIRYVEETTQLRHVAKVPRAADYILGISSLRGQLFPLIDLRRFFGMNEKGLTAVTKVIILRINELALGIITDGLLGHGEVLISEIIPLQPGLEQPGREFIMGMTTSGILVLDGIKLYESEKINPK